MGTLYRPRFESSPDLASAFARRARRLTLGSFLALLTLVAGCSRGPELVPVAGVVALDGQPVADAGVVFQPVGSGPIAAATTDGKGRYRLISMNRPGAMPGLYRVTIAKKETTGLIRVAVVGPQGVQIKWIVPKKYSQPETSGLQASVSREHGEFNFELLSH